MLEVNIEYGFPTTEQAIAKMVSAIVVNKHNGVKAIKIIHGYGSTGRGGAIKLACKQKLILMKRLGNIRDFCEGEQFNSNSEAGIRVTSRLSNLKGDRDWKIPNPGITVVVL